MSGTNVNESSKTLKETPRTGVEQAGGGEKQQPPTPNDPSRETGNPIPQEVPNEQPHQPENSPEKMRP